jgi:hypothetical protein
MKSPKKESIRTDPEAMHWKLNPAETVFILNREEKINNSFSIFYFL